MISTSNGWREAISGDVRRVRVRISARVADPELEYGNVTAADEASFSHSDQVKDGDYSGGGNYATGEAGRWILNGQTKLLTDQMSLDEQIGYVSGSRSGTDGTFSTAPEVSVAVEGVEALRAVTIQFPSGEMDGFGVDFTVAASASGTVLDSVTVTDNTERMVMVPMSAANPDTITVSVSKWSLPDRRARIMEIFPGFSVDWTASDITGLSVKLQCSLSTMQQPYSTASVTLDNSTNLFDPLDKSSMFQAIEEGQGFPLEIGVDVNGTPEYLPMGVFYHHNQGWSQNDSNMTMKFDLVDIIGLLADVDFTAPETAQTTLSGWLSAIVASLGTRFEGHYGFDPDYLSDYAITADPAELDGKSCTEVLRLLCQASGCIAQTRRADGYLLLRSEMETGPDMTLDNLTEYPTFLANDYMGSITFTLPDGNDGTADYQVFGPDNTSKNTARISNPFITTESAAQEIAQRIFSAYGGNKISLRGRGEPSAELGDVVWVQTKAGADASGRIISQTFQYSGGVLEGCQTELLHTETRYNTYGHRVVFTEDGTWTVPEGVTKVHVVLIGGGDGGGAGYWWPSEVYEPYWNRHYVAQYGNQREDGSYEYNVTVWYAFVDKSNGTKGLPDGETGKGGKVLSRVVAVNPGETMNIVIGHGGAAALAIPSGTTPKPFEAEHNATPGTATTFGSYTSDNGERHSGAYTDIFAGGSYAKSGQDVVTANSGNGGKGGTAADWVREPVASQIYYDSAFNQYVSKLYYPLAWYGPEVSNTTAGRSAQFYATDGTDGSSGICIIYYNDPPEEDAT